jgi:hypothetical protein
MFTKAYIPEPRTLAFLGMLDNTPFLVLASQIPLLLTTVIHYI